MPQAPSGPLHAMPMTEHRYGSVVVSTRQDSIMTSISIGMRTQEPSGWLAIHQLRYASLIISVILPE